MKQKLLLIHLFLLLFSISGFTQTGPGGVTDGLRIWLRPEIGITTSGSNVISWADQSGVAIPNDFDQTNASVQPTIAPAEVMYNFHPAVNFNGSNFMRSKVAEAAPFTKDVGNGTLYVVHNWRSDAGTSLTTPVFGLGDAPMGIDPGYSATRPLIGMEGSYILSLKAESLVMRSDSRFTAPVRKSFIQGTAWSNEEGATKIRFNNSGLYSEANYPGRLSTFGGADGAILGLQKKPNGSYKGYIQEVIAYQKQLSLAEMLRIDSYLMIKYGISGNAINDGRISYLLDSGSNKIWTWAATASNGGSRYYYNVAAIGRDDSSALNQKQSQSVEDNFQITIGLKTIEPTNSENFAAFEQDKSFMFWADNNGETDFTRLISGHTPSMRFARVWKIQETGKVGTVKFAVPFAIGKETSRFFLVRSTDETFDKSDEYIPLKKFTSGTTTYWACDVDFNDKDYFTLAVDDNPESIALSFTPDDSTVTKVAEGKEQMVTVGFPPGVTLDTDTVANFSITGTAINGTDYTTIENSVMIPAGQNSVTINIQALSDFIIETDETVILTGTSVTSASGATWSTGKGKKIAMVTITDSNPLSDRVLCFSPTTENVAEGSSTTLKVSLSEGITAVNDITFSYRVSGTAISGKDYVALSGTGTIKAGENFAAIVIDALTDTIIEFDETVIIDGIGTIAAGPLTGFTWDDTANMATVTIADVTVAENKVLNFSPTNAAVAEGSSISMRVSLPAGVTLVYPQIVNYTVSGTAINGTDYTALTGSVTIPAGSSYATIEIAALTDNLIELDETVVITGGDTEGFTWGGDNVATIIINDVTSPAKKVLSISPLTKSVAEGESTTIKISLPEGITVTSPMDINYKVLGTAINGTDYTTLTGTATIPAGSGTAIIEVNALTDNLLEANETIVIMGVATTGFTWSATANTAMVTITDSNPLSDKVLRFSPTTVSTPEGTSTTLEVRLSEKITAVNDITFSYIVKGTATSGKDYTPLTGRGKILAGENFASIVVTALTDTIIEGDETVVLTGDDIVGGAIVESLLTGFSWDGAAKEATVTITDETDEANKVLNFSPTTANVAEGSSTSIKVSLPEGVTMGYPQIVNYTVSGTATSDTDYSALTGSVTIPAGDGYAMIAVTAKNDNLIEPDETVVITGGTVSGFTWGSDNVATIIINDVTSPAKKVLSISPSIAKVAEGESTTIKISLPEGITVTSPMDINYKVLGTAINGTDYETLSGVATIPAGSGTAEITIVAKNDNLLEANETIIITGAATAGFTWSATANTAMVTITDSNPLSDKVLRFSLKEVSIQEGDDLFVYVRLPEGIITTKDITFNYTVTGTATPNWGWRDYVELTGTGTILAGQKEGWININTFKDTVIEDDETIILTGSVITAGPLTGFTWDDAANTATVTITDVTDEANKVLHFSPITAAVAEGSGTGIQVSLPEGVALGYPQIVNYTISGTAINGTDYKELTGSVTIYTHTYSAYIWIAAENDNLIEPDETVVITGGTVSGFTWGSDNVATVTIKDATGTDPAKKVLSISPLTASVAEGESTTIKISLPEGITVTSPMDINYKVLGTAINGTDYVTLTGTATIPTGSGTAIIEVNALTDNLLEANETIVIMGVATAGFTWSATANTAMVTITDSNPLSDKVLRFSPTTVSTPEGTSTTLEVRLSEKITAVNDITFSYIVKGTATSGKDYTPLTGRGKILAGENFASIVVTALTDTIIEGDETVVLTGDDIVGGAIVESLLTGFSWDGAAKEATVTITDETDEANKVLNFSPTTAAVAEGSSTSIKVSLPEGVTLGYPQIVNYNLSGTAINGTDYSALTGSVTIPAGLSYATIAVTALPDNLIEPDETVVITGAITAGFTWGSNNVATVSIKDATGNDPAKKVLSISPLIANVAEGESTTIKISLPEGITVTSPMDINYKVLGTAINGTDYVTLTGTATIPAGSGTAIIEVNALTDNLLESDETIIITGVATAGFTWSAIANTAMVTITDVTDPANKVLRFSPTTAAVAEGSSASIKVSLPEGIITTKDITFSYGVSGTATSVYDYTSLTGTGTILAGNNSLDIVVTALMDSIIEGDETVILTGSSIQGGSLTGFSWDDAAKEATVTITDVTDSAEKVLNFSPTTAAVAEGSSTSIKVSLPEGVTLGYPQIVNYKLSGTAANDTDYTALTGSVTIPAGSSYATIEIAAKNDNLIEPDETVVITGAITAGFTWGSDNVATVAITDATDPTKKVFSFSPSKAKVAASVREGESTVLLVRLPEGITVTSPVNLNYRISGTATEGVDYTTLTGVATIPAGSGTAEITIDAKNDNLLEGEETIVITGAATAGFTWSATANTATVTITDSNPLSDKVLRFSPATENVAEGSFTTITVSLPKDITATKDITFSYALGGDATLGLDDDYVLLDGFASDDAVSDTVTNGHKSAQSSGTIPAGKNFAEIIVSTITDKVIERDETVILTGGVITAGSLTGFSWDGAAKEATVTITDVTDEANKVLNFSPITANVAEGSSTNVKVSFPEGYTMGYPLTVNYIISDSSTATNGADYEGLTGSVTIAKGSRSATIEVVALSDTIIESDETVLITGSTTAGFTWGSDNLATITITDVTDSENKVLSISPATANIKEGESTTLTVSLPRGVSTATDFVVNYTLSGTATNGTDYTALSGKVTIPAGQISGVINIEALEDGVIEPNETVLITGAATAGFTWDAAAKEALVTIIDLNREEANNRIVSLSTETIYLEDPLVILTASLPSGVTLSEAIYVNLDNTFSSFSDLSMDNFVIIPAGQNSAEFEVRAGNKRKNNERVEITGSVNNLIFDTTTYSFTLESGAVIVKNDLLEIENVVSANGDGINDYFAIRNIEKYKDNTVTIVDRRGIEVFSARGYDNQSTYFDGRNSGKDLDDGTYFYFITISHKGIEHQYKGFLVLKR